MAENTDGKVGIHTSERGDAIQTHSGRAWYFADPRPEDVCVDDVVWSLSRAPRFGGHASRTYTVLEHCVRCCDLWLWRSGFSVWDSRPSEIHGQTWTVRGVLCSTVSSWDYRGPLFQDICRRALLCLCHDAAEAYVLDLPRPLKVNVPGYRAVEAQTDAAVWCALCETPPTATEHADVKLIDVAPLRRDRPLAAGVGAGQGEHGGVVRCRRRVHGRRPG